MPWISAREGVEEGGLGGWDVRGDGDGAAVDLHCCCSQGLECADDARQRQAGVGLDLAADCQGVMAGVGCFGSLVGAS